MSTTGKKPHQVLNDEFYDEPPGATYGPTPKHAAPAFQALSALGEELGCGDPPRWLTWKRRLSQPWLPFWSPHSTETWHSPVPILFLLLSPPGDPQYAPCTLTPQSGTRDDRCFVRTLSPATTGVLGWWGKQHEEDWCRETCFFLKHQSQLFTSTSWKIKSHVTC